MAKKNQNLHVVKKNQSFHVAPFSGKEAEIQAIVEKTLHDAKLFLLKLASEYNL